VGRLEPTEAWVRYVYFQCEGCRRPVLKLSKGLNLAPMGEDPLFVSPFF
jgi:hypothetical protein